MNENTEPKTNAEPEAGLPEPRLALLFLTRGDLHQPRVWEEFLEGAGSESPLFLHAKHPEAVVSPVLKRAARVPVLPTEWGGISLVRATLRLLGAALADSGATHFALVSESCVPVKPAEEILTRLALDGRSRIAWEGLHEMSLEHRWRSGKAAGVPPDRWRMQHQWMVLDREMAEIVLEEDLTGRFGEVFAPDEHYFATVLAMKGVRLEDRVRKVLATWVDWRSNAPRTVAAVDGRLAASLRESPAFFARKFGPESNIGDWRLHVSCGGAGSGPAHAAARARAWLGTAAADRERRAPAETGRILVAVCSARDNADRRRICRETWAGSAGDGTPVLFFTGGGAPFPDEPDTVAVGADDSPGFRPSKVMAMLRHALGNLDFGWLFKCDDDTYVDLGRLRELAESGVDLVGNPGLWQRGAPDGGAGYLLSREMVLKLVLEGGVAPRGAEDLLVGREALRLGARARVSDRLLATASPYPRPDNDLVTASHCEPVRMRAIHTLRHTVPVIELEVEHPSWHDRLLVHADGTFARRKGHCAGIITEDARGGILQWFDWRPERLVETEEGCPLDFWVEPEEPEGEGCPDRAGPQVPAEAGGTAAAIPARAVFSLSTSPGRIGTIATTIRSLLNQTRVPDLIHVNCPFVFKRTGGVFADEDLEALARLAPGIVQVNRCEDMGPVSKLLPALELEPDPETVVITVDDDNWYPSATLERMLGDCAAHRESVLANRVWNFDGEPPIEIAEGWTGVAIRRGLIDLDDLLDFVRTAVADHDCYRSDDLVLSYYYRMRGIPVRLCSRPIRTLVLGEINGDEHALHKQDGVFHDVRYRRCLRVLENQSGEARPSPDSDSERKVPPQRPGTAGGGVARGTRRAAPRWGVFTTYLPRENLPYLEEWLQWHIGLGASFFHLYDNTGSTTLEMGNSMAVNGRTKYGHRPDLSLSDDEVLEIEREIIRRYPVEKVMWQPRENGRIVWGHVAACDHFSKVVTEGWCAFIDMDEFILPLAPLAELLRGGAVRIRQRKFADRADYGRALDCERTFSINTREWGSKLIMDMECYLPGGARNVHELRSARPAIELDPEQIWFNHYNHGPAGHRWLLENHQHIDPQWQPKPFEEVFDGNCRLARDMARQWVRYENFVPVLLGRPVPQVEPGT